MRIFILSSFHFSWLKNRQRFKLNEFLKKLNQRRYFELKFSSLRVEFFLCFCYEGYFKNGTCTDLAKRSKINWFLRIITFKKHTSFSIVATWWLSMCKRMEFQKSGSISHAPAEPAIKEDEDENNETSWNGNGSGSNSGATAASCGHGPSMGGAVSSPGGGSTTSQEGSTGGNLPANATSTSLQDREQRETPPKEYK